MELNTGAAVDDAKPVRRAARGAITVGLLALSGAATVAAISEIAVLTSGSSLPAGFEEARRSLLEFRLYSLAFDIAAAVLGAVWWVPHMTEFRPRWPAWRWLPPPAVCVFGAGGIAAPLLVEATITIWNSFPH